MGCGQTGAGLVLVLSLLEVELRCALDPAPTRHLHPGGWIVPGLPARVKVVSLVRTGT